MDETEKGEPEQYDGRREGKKGKGKTIADKKKTEKSGRKEIKEEKMETRVLTHLLSSL